MRTVSIASGSIACGLACGLACLAAAWIAGCATERLGAVAPTGVNLTGEWKFNPNLSDDPDKLADPDKPAPQRSPGGHRGHGGGRGGGGGVPPVGSPGGTGDGFTAALGGSTPAAGGSTLAAIDSTSAVSSFTPAARALRSAASDVTPEANGFTPVVARSFTPAADGHTPAADEYATAAGGGFLPVVLTAQMEQAPPLPPGGGTPATGGSSKSRGASINRLLKAPMHVSIAQKDGTLSITADMPDGTHTADEYTAGTKNTIPYGSDSTAERTVGWRGTVFVITTSAKKGGWREDDFALDDDGRLIMTTQTKGGRLGTVEITRVYDRMRGAQAQ
jgi:hypothetical protein